MRTQQALQRIDLLAPVPSGNTDDDGGSVRPRLTASPGIAESHTLCKNLPVDAYTCDVDEASQRARGDLASAVAQRTAQLTDLSQYLIGLAEEEKQRLAAELHDELGALHTVISMELERVLHDLRARAPDLVERQITAIGLLHQAIDIKRRIIADLRPVMLHDLGLVATLAGHAERWSRDAGIHARLQLPDAFPSLPERVELALFRIAQESLINVGKYARATEVTIVLAIAGDELVLSVVDNGIGIGPDTLEQPRSHGILGMRQRIAQCGGELMITPGPGGVGTAVSARLDVSLYAEADADAPASDDIAADARQARAQVARTIPPPAARGLPP